MTRPNPLIVVIASLLLALGTSGCGGSREDADSVSASVGPRTRPVAAIELVPRDLTRQVDLVATVRPRHVIRVPARMSGRLEAVAVEEGDRVEAGAVLARFDTAEQEAELSRAAAEVRHARIELENMRQLRATEAVSRIEFERARVALEVAEAEQRLWQTRVDFGLVRAPREGVISARHVEPGEAVGANAHLLDLSVMDTLVVRPLVSERDVVHLEPGASARIRIDALADAEFEGRLARIFPSADADSRLIPVEFDLPGDAGEGGVRPGFLARITISVDPRPGVLAVPAAAVGEDGAERYLYAIVDGRLQRRRVEPGVTRGQWTEIRRGVAVGDVVLATNPIDMRPGDHVRIVGWRG